MVDEETGTEYLHSGEKMKPYLTRNLIHHASMNSLPSQKALKERTPQGKETHSKMEKYSSLSKGLKLSNSKNKENINIEPPYSETISEAKINEVKPSLHLYEKKRQNQQVNKNVNYHRRGSVSELKQERERSCRESIELQNTLLKTKNVLKEL